MFVVRGRDAANLIEQQRKILRRQNARLGSFLRVGLHPIRCSLRTSATTDHARSLASLPFSGLHTSRLRAPSHHDNARGDEPSDDHGQMIVFQIAVTASTAPALLQLPPSNACTLSASPRRTQTGHLALYLHFAQGAGDALLNRAECQKMHQTIQYHTVKHPNVTYVSRGSLPEPGALRTAISQPQKSPKRRKCRRSGSWFATNQPRRAP